MENKTLLADVLGRFVAEQRFEAIPQPVLRRAKLLMLDAVGIAFASTRYEFAHRTLTALAGMGSGDADVIGMPKRLALRDAVLMNGVLVHGLDYDDTYLPGSVHLSASCVPTSLAMAAHVHASGRDLLAAFVLGLEIDARLGAAGKGGFLRAGFHATSMCGTFACTMIAGRLLNMTRAQLVMAQGIALSTVSGTVQPAQDGSWTKRMHPGWSGVSGITAAMLARQGFIGPTEAYEGRFGLYPCYLREHAAQADLSLASRDLGAHWEFMRSSIKLYPVCHQSHAFMNAASKLGRQHKIDPGEVKHILARVAEVAVPLICEPIEAKRKPESSYGAQFSLPYHIACCLTRGRFGMNELEETSYADPTLRALAQKMDYEIDPDSGFPKTRTGEVIVTMKNGERHVCREAIDPDQPESEEGIVAKFMDNASLAMSAERAEKIRSLILDLESAADAQSITHALTGGA